MTLYVAVEAPHLWARSPVRGAVAERGVLDHLEDLPVAQGSAVVGVVPGQQVAVHRVTLPTRNRNKAAAAIPFALEERLASDVEDLFFPILKWESQGETLAGVVARTRLDGWLEALKSAGLKVASLIPEYLMLPLHPRTEYTIAPGREGSSICVRGRDGWGASFDRSALDQWWAALDNAAIPVAVADSGLARELIAAGASNVHEWDIGPDFSHWLDHGRPPAGVNLLQGAYAPVQRARTRRAYRVAATLLGLALLLRAGFDGAELLKLSAEHRQLESEIEQTLTGTFPDISRVVNPRLQMAQRVAQLTQSSAGAGGFQVMLSAVAGAAPRANALIEEVDYREGTLVVICSTTDFAALDRLTGLFRDNPAVDVSLSSSGSRDNRVTGRFQLRLASG